MMSKIKALASETVLYGLGNIIPKVLGFFLVTLHTLVFVPAEYGKFTLISACVTFINIIFSFGMETAFFRFATKPEADSRKVYDQVQSIIFSISISLSVFFIAFRNPIAHLFHIENNPELIIWVTAVMLVDAVVAIPFARLRLRKQPLKYALAKIINIFLYIGFSYYFLRINYHPSIGIGYIFLANLIANGSYLLFFAKDLLEWRPSADRSLAIALLKYGWPIMLGGLAWAVNEMFSRTMLEAWLPADFYGKESKDTALGVFGACYKFSALMNLAVQAFRYAAEPFFFSNASDKNSPALFARVNHYFIIVCCVLLLAISINMDVLKFFLAKPAYWSGISVVPVLLLAYLFLGLYYNFSAWYKLTDKTYVGTILFGGGAALTVILNYLLIPVYGYTGSSWATLIVYFLMALSCYLLGQKYYPIPYRVLNGAAYILATVVLIYGVSLIEIPSLWAAIPFHSAIVLAFAGVATLLERRRKPI